LFFETDLVGQFHFPVFLIIAMPSTHQQMSRCTMTTGLSAHYLPSSLLVCVCQTKPLRVGYRIYTTPCCSRQSRRVRSDVSCDIKRFRTIKTKKSCDSLHSHIHIAIHCTARPIQ
ncbi:MAG: hypothetical protein ABW176_12670, partial [Candidatus Thiodiazotropha endolucinida]